MKERLLQESKNESLIMIKDGKKEGQEEYQPIAQQTTSKPTSN